MGAPTTVVAAAKRPGVAAAIPPAVDALEAARRSQSARIGVTVLAFALAVLGTLAVRRLGRPLKDRLGTTLVEVAQTLAVAGLWIAAIGSLLVVWEATEQVASALAVLNVSQTQMVLAVVTVLVLIAAYTITRLTRRWIARLTENHSAVSGHEREIFHHVVQLTVFAASLLVILSLWEVPVGNLLLGAGFLGIVIGFAARQTLGQMLAGFVVLLSRPFEIGDWIEVGDNEGIVTEITVVNTRLQTFDGEYVMIPNDRVTAQDVVNRSRKGRLRVEIEVGVDYATDVERAMAVARGAMGDLDTVLSVPQPRVVGKRFADSAVVLGLRFWIDNPSARRRWRAQTEVLSAVKAAFADEGITIPFPQRTLGGREEAGGLQVSASEGEAVPVEPRNRGDGTAGDGENGDAASAADEPDAEDTGTGEDSADTADAPDLEAAAAEADDGVETGDDGNSEQAEADEEGTDETDGESGGSANDAPADADSRSDNELAVGDAEDEAGDGEGER